MAAGWIVERLPCPRSFAVLYLTAGAISIVSILLFGLLDDPAVHEEDRVIRPRLADLVARFRVAGAPLPLILVIAPNGVAAGGVLAGQASVEKLVKLAPSPKKTEVLSALQSGKAVFITAARKGMGAQVMAQESCARASGQVGAASISILVNMDDPAEAQFLADLKVSPLATEPVTVVVNAVGQVTGTFVGAAAVGDLVAAARKKGGGCAPGACGPGSGKSCGPAGAK